MNGEDLVYDWQHNVVDEPSEWGFNWEYAEGGTANPVAKQHHATMWLVMNEDDPIFAVKIFFRHAEKQHKIKLKVKAPSGEHEPYEFEVRHGRTRDLLLTGRMKDPKSGDPDPNVGHYAEFKATSAKGSDLAKRLVEGALLHGMQAFMPHECIETNVYDDYRLVTVTGEGEDNEGLATRFTLFNKDEEVARCHLTYRDGSWDPSFGPTVEMLAVKQSRRGEGLAKFLWYHVRRFIEVNFTIECLNNDAPLKHVMIKATQVGTNEVEIRLEKDGTRHPMGFKEFLFDYCGFSVREQKGAAAYLFGSRRIKDEEAVLYIPLLKRGEPSTKKASKPGRAVYRENPGARMCHWCTAVDMEKSRCTRCGIAFYCNRECQLKDHSRHRLWCNKTREQVRAKLIKQGNMIPTDDGSYSLVMNGPNRTFGYL